LSKTKIENEILYRFVMMMNDDDDDGAVWAGASLFPAAHYRFPSVLDFGCCAL